MLTFPVEEIETPAYVVDLGALRHNLEILADVQRRAGCKILLALKGFALWPVFPLVREHLSGATASSPHEARLAREELGGEVHAYAPAYREADVRELCGLVDHLVFNSPTQWARLRPLAAAQNPSVSCGIRVNPEHSEVKVPLYDPCAAGSRLGATAASLRGAELPGLDGLHFHTLCELGADALARTLPAVEARFGELLRRVSWVNMGGGHHITRLDYDRDLLVELVRGFADRHGVDVYLEPGEAIAIETGALVASVLDLARNGEVEIAILDTSATAHMPDVLEMPYRPRIVGGGEPGEHPYTYRLGGLTCLAGDVIGDWSFPEPLRIGQKLVFLDMAHYTMVKNTTFNGVRLPSIATWDPETRDLRVQRRFGYEDYKGRLG
jgi:carboxynorspermidine decarboxylase